jgi:GTPase SAR1 family protein
MIKLNDLIQKGVSARAQRITIFGPNGIGKTSLAAAFPEPLFIDTEDGSTHLNVARIQASEPESFFDALRQLGNEEHSYQTLVIDTIDAVEKHLRYRVCKRHKMAGIEDFGYGRGWSYLREELDLFLTGCLDRFIRQGIHVVVVGHSTVKRVQPPGLSDAYDRYELKLDLVNSNRLKEWSDAVLFLNWDTRIQENAEGRRRGIGGKERMIYTQHSTAYDAKNRVNLPEKVKCEFAELVPLLVNHIRPPTVSLQQQLQAAVSNINPAFVEAFLLDRKQIAAGQSILDVPAEYAAEALSRLQEFREAVTAFALIEKQEPLT